MAVEQTTIYIIVGGNPQNQIIYAMRTFNRHMILRQMWLYLHHGISSISLE